MDAGSLEVIYRGAEATLYKGVYAGIPAVFKIRHPKKYRHPLLDERIRRVRTLREARSLMDAREAGVPVPAVLLVEPEDALLIMEHVEGISLREQLGTIRGAEMSRIFRVLGRIAARLHRAGLIHGDFTTSNVLVTKSGKPVLIDFGLSTRSQRLEDMGVDVHVLLRSIESTIPEAAGEAYKAFLEGYRGEAGQRAAEEIAEKVREIRLRGRYVEERRRK